MSFSLISNLPRVFPLTVVNVAEFSSQDWARARATGQKRRREREGEREREDELFRGMTYFFPRGLLAQMVRAPAAIVRGSQGRNLHNPNFSFLFQRAMSLAPIF